jgi:hypothetical protein
MGLPFSHWSLYWFLSLVILSLSSELGNADLAGRYAVPFKTVTCSAARL